MVPQPEADPDVTVQISGDRTPMLARTADPPERAELWPRLVELYRDYDSYQSWTDREIPVVILDPRCRRPPATEDVA